MQTNNELILTFFLPCQSRVDQSVFAQKKKKTHTLPYQDL